MKDGYQRGMIAGAIAGVADGVVTNISSKLAPIIGLWEALPGEFSLAVWLTELVASIEWNVLWGVVFGLAFAMVYDRIPSTGIKKGLIFSSIFYFLLGDVRTANILFGFSGIHEVLAMMTKAFVFVGLFASIAYGLVLGALYKR